MKQRFLLMFCLSLFTLSCEKDITPPVDEIVYKDIIPDKEIQTVRFYTLQDHIVCTARIPTPTDSAVTYEMDLDNNQIADFRLHVAHSKYTLGYCGHCDRFTYNIYIEGISEKDSIAASPLNDYVVKIFNTSDTVSAQNTWRARAELLLLEGCSLPFQTDFSNGYLGIKINKSYGYIKIEKMSNNGIRILEHGFNKTENNPIICGQTK